MADATSTIVLTPRPLVTTDAAALTASIEAKSGFQPAFIAETLVDEANETAMPTALTADEDVWRIIFELSGPMPGYILYPYAFTGDLVMGGALTAFNTLFEDDAAFQISVNPLSASRSGWRAFTLGPVLFGGPNNITNRDISPELKGFPVRARTAGGGGSLVRVGELLLTVATADVTATAATSIDIDFRLLMFPEAAAENAGFYTPSLFFHPR